MAHVRVDVAKMVPERQMHATHAAEVGVAPVRRMYVTHVAEVGAVKEMQMYARLAAAEDARRLAGVEEGMIPS